MNRLVNGLPGCNAAALECAVEVAYGSKGMLRGFTCTALRRWFGVDPLMLRIATHMYHNKKSYIITLCTGRAVSGTSIILVANTLCMVEHRQQSKVLELSLHMVNYVHGVRAHLVLEPRSTQADCHTAFSGSMRSAVSPSSD